MSCDVALGSCLCSSDQAIPSAGMVFYVAATAWGTDDSCILRPMPLACLPWQRSSSELWALRASKAPGGRRKRNVSGGASRGGGGGGVDVAFRQISETTTQKGIRATALAVYQRISHIAFLQHQGKPGTFRFRAPHCVDSIMHD